MVVTKEKNSDTVQLPNFCSIKILGEKKTKENYVNFTDYNIMFGKYIDRHSKGYIKFSSDVNTTFVKENFDVLFSSQMKNVTWRNHKTYWKMKRQLEFHAQNESDANDILNYTATFHEPFLLGLLVKKKDLVYFTFDTSLLN